jgi:hypothetical protein
VENNSNWVELLLHDDLLSIAVKNPQIHNNHGCTTTINWFRRTCNESKITLYYWLRTMSIMQFTNLLCIISFPFFCSFFSSKTRLFYWPWKPAKITRRNNPPEKSTMATCWIHPRLKPAKFTRRKNPPFQLVACLPEVPPFLLKIPRQDSARHPSPPGSSANGAGGGGREPARPTHASWTGTFTFIPLFMNGYISLYDTIHTYSIQSGLIWKYKYIAVGEGIIC